VSGYVPTCAASSIQGVPSPPGPPITLGNSLNRNFAAENAGEHMETFLHHWRRKKGKCESNERVICPPCIAGNQKKCLSLSGTGKLFNRMTGRLRDSLSVTEKLLNRKTEIGKISSLYALVFSDSVCTTIKLDLGEELWALTPPWEALGLSDSLGNFTFTLSNTSCPRYSG
jgi:hypothetical protein